LAISTLRRAHSLIAMGWYSGIRDFSVSLSLAMTLIFLALCLAVAGWMLKTGYRLKA